MLLVLRILPFIFCSTQYSATMANHDLLHMTSSQFGPHRGDEGKLSVHKRQVMTGLKMNMRYEYKMLLQYEIL